MASQIHLLRHGETAWSLTGQHKGRTDLPLTENGERRASALRGRLQGITFNHVLTSLLQRARRTCDLAGFGAVAREEPDLQEWDYGDYEGMTTAAIREQRPGLACLSRWLSARGIDQGEGGSAGEVTRDCARSSWPNSWFP